MPSWREFWDGEHHIYANARHKQVHFASIKASILGHLPAHGGDILDYGCGEAPLAHEIALHVHSLTLSDGAPSVMAQLKHKFQHEPRITYLTPEQLPLSTQTFDRIIMCSVAQYLKPQELLNIMETFQTKLKPHGEVILGDLISPHTGLLDDVLSLLKLSLKEGFFISALLSLVRTTFSSYRHIRQQLGLSTYDAQTLTTQLQSMGFKIIRHTPNMGLHQHRYTLRAILK